MKDKINESKIREEFRALIPSLEDWGKYVDDCLNEFAKETFKRPELVQYYDS